MRIIVGLLTIAAGVALVAGSRGRLSTARINIIDGTQIIKLNAEPEKDLNSLEDLLSVTEKLNPGPFMSPMVDDVLVALKRMQHPNTKVVGDVTVFDLIDLNNFDEGMDCKRRKLNERADKFNTIVQGGPRFENILTYVRKCFLRAATHCAMAEGVKDQHEQAWRAGLRNVIETFVHAPPGLILRKVMEYVEDPNAPNPPPSQHKRVKAQVVSEPAAPSEEEEPEEFNGEEQEVPSSFEQEVPSSFEHEAPSSFEHEAPSSFEHEVPSSVEAEKPSSVDEVKPESEAKPSHETGSN